MKIITLHQPWASLIAVGLKHYETRHWETNYRGKIAIHAGKKAVDISGIEAWRRAWKITKQDAPDDLPLGVIVAIADLTNIYLMDESLTVSPLEKLIGNWEYGRFAWHLDNIIALPNPIPFRGQQGLKPVPLDLCDRLLKEVDQCYP